MMTRDPRQSAFDAGMVEAPEGTETRPATKPVWRHH
jgi:hypothetical protein